VGMLEGTSKLLPVRQSRRSHSADQDYNFGKWGRGDVRDLFRRTSIIVERHEGHFSAAAGTCVLAAVVGLLFERQFPFLHPLIIWTFRVYFGAFVSFLVGLLIVGPGVCCSGTSIRLCSLPKHRGWKSA
jgi:hypothetical protein